MAQAKAKEVERVQVVATKQGYDNVALREPGDVFTVPADWLNRPHSWFQKAVTRPVTAVEVVAATDDGEGMV